jgi:CHAT domain-containing protein/tetratricopeptide (TPR) repeat protein
MTNDFAGQPSVVTILPTQARRSSAPSPLSGPWLNSWRRGALLLALGLPGCAAQPPAKTPPPMPPVAAVAVAAPALTPGGSVERSLPPEGRDEIVLYADAGFYLRVTFETRGNEDLAASVLAPGGEEILRTAGSDVQLSWLAPNRGTYRIVITQREPVPKGSSYRLSLRDARPSRAGDEIRLSAERALAEAKLLECEKAYPAALAKAQASLSDWNRLADPAGRFEAMYEIGLLENRSASGKDLEAALRWYRQALQAAQESGDPRAVAKAQKAIGSALFVTHHEDEAEALFRAALPVLEESGDASSLADVLLRLGIRSYDVGDYDAAQDLWRQALTHAESGAPKLVPAILNGLGSILLARGSTGEALERYRRALDLAQQGGDARQQAAALAGLGAIDRRRGRPQEALGKLSAALAINHHDPALRAEEGKTLDLMGTVDLDLGDPGKALAEFRGATDVFRGVRDRAWLARSLGVLGNAELATGRVQEALATYHEMRTVAEAEKLDVQRGAALHGIGSAQRRMGQLTEAVGSLEAALAFRQGKERLAEALTRQELGETFQAQGDLARAEPSLREALRIADAMEAQLPRASLHYDLALLERKKEDLGAAVAEIEQAIRILETVRADLSEDRLRTSFFASRRSYYDLYVDLLMELERRHPRQGEAERALAASDQGHARSLLDLLGRLELTRGISPPLRQAEAEAAARLSQLQSELLNESLNKARPGVQADLKQRLTDAEAEQRAIEQRIKAESPDYYNVRYPSLLKSGEIQSLLDADSALLEYSLGEQASYLFVVTREGGLKAHRLDLSRDAIAAEAAKVRGAIERPGELSYAYQAAALKLYRTLVAPALAELEGKRRLLIAADGPLNHLPFDALLTDRAQDDAGLRPLYLLNRFTVSYIPSASVLSSLLAASRPAVAGEAPRFLAFAPSYGGEPGAGGKASRSEPGGGLALPALAGAEAEVRAIAARYPGKARLYLGPEASLDNVKKGSLASECVHFAGHGLLDEAHPERSGLLLEGGLLTVSDIFNLDMRAGLVVLSACETAGTEVSGEGLVGLTRAFLYAGSPSVVVTLWRVEDRKTSDLMLRFYTNLDQNGDKSEALRQAKLSLLDRGGAPAHPYYWAPFILVGRPR